jgi:hypothetical protein
MVDALGLRVEHLLGQGVRNTAASAPGGRARAVFDKISKLPKRRRQKVLGVAEAFISRHDKVA